MRVLYYSNYSHRTSLSQDSAWNLAIEFLKYAIRKYGERGEPFIMYLPKDVKRTGYRGDEQRYVDSGNLYIIEYSDAPTDGRFSTWTISEEFALAANRMNVFKDGSKDPLFYDILYTTLPYGYFLSQYLNAFTGHMGLPVNCRFGAGLA